MQTADKGSEWWKGGASPPQRKYCRRPVASEMKLFSNLPCGVVTSDDFCLTVLQLIERHLFLMLAEFAIFMFIVGWCTSRQRHAIPRPTAVLQGVPATPTQATVANSQATGGGKNFVRGHRRHRSIDSPSPARGRAGLGPLAALPRTRNDSDLRKSGKWCDQGLNSWCAYCMCREREANQLWF